MHCNRTLFSSILPFKKPSGLKIQRLSNVSISYYLLDIEQLDSNEKYFPIITENAKFHDI